MSAKMALMLVEKLAIIAMIFQAAEILKGAREWREGGIWSWSRLSLEYDKQTRELLNRLMNDNVFHRLLQGQIAVAAICFFVPGFSLLATILLTYLFGTTLLVAIRFRGSFNGGSDSMTLMTLLSLMIATAFARNHTAHIICLWFLTLQVCRSFLTSGVSKLKSRAWREGSAMKDLTTVSNYGPPNWARQFLSQGQNSKYLGVVVLGFELLFVTGLLNQDLAALFIGVALVFHLMNYYVFGLNRFVFAWLAVYPAFYYCSHA